MWPSTEARIDASPSNTRTVMPARAKTIAQPEPTRPAPTMATLLMPAMAQATREGSPSARQISVIRSPSSVMREGKRSRRRSSWIGMTRRDS